MDSLVDKLCQLDCQPICIVQEMQVSVASDADNGTDLWHQRLGHINKQLLQEMVSKELVEGVTVSKSQSSYSVRAVLKEQCT